MPLKDLAAAVLSYYPQIYFACHTRHTRDPETGKKISQRQISILDHLDRVEATAITDLAGHMGVTPSTISIAVDRLERRGYVRRSRGAEDARRVLVRLTEAGARIREAHSVLDEKRVTALLAELAPAEREQAVEGLGLLARAAKRVMRKQSRQSSWAQRSEKTTRERGSPS